MTRDRLTAMLDVAGFAAIAGAGFAITLWLGLILAGGSLLILSWKLNRN